MGHEYKFVSEKKGTFVTNTNCNGAILLTKVVFLSEFWVQGILHILWWFICIYVESYAFVVVVLLCCFAAYVCPVCLS